MDLVTIIIPVYNVEEYLEQCIESVCAQTYKNLEIILVDDGSTDKSAQICDRYALDDKRIKVIHQKNKGLSAARNKGLENAAGKYISFIDSDDAVALNYIETLYILIKKSGAQISACAYTRDISRLNTLAFPDFNISSKKLLKKWHGKYKKIETVVWNKLYDRMIFKQTGPKNEFFDNKVFPEGFLHEDIYTSHLFIDNAEEIAVTGQRLYYYRTRNESISKTYTPQAAAADLNAQKARLSFFLHKKYYGAYLRLLKGHLLHKVMYMAKKIKV